MLSDLKGKRVGILKGSQAEFLFSPDYYYLTKSPHRMYMLLISVPRSRFRRLRMATIDAALVWEPYVQKLKDTFGEQTLSAFRLKAVRIFTGCLSAETA